MTFAKRLESLRLQRGYSQSEMANMVNVSQPSYWAYENGKSIPHKNTQIQLARVLGVSVEELMKDETEPFPETNIT